MRNLTALLLMMLCSSALANSSFDRANITEIILHDWGSLVIVFEEPVNQAEGCTNSGMVVVLPSHQFFDQIYAAALAAYHSDRKLHGWVHGCHLQHNAPILTRLDMDKFD